MTFLARHPEGGPRNVIFQSARRRHLFPTNIEKSFNDIWGLKQSRSWVQRFQAYWPLLTLAPFLLGVSLALSARFESSSTYGEIVSTFPLASFFRWLAPIVLTWLGFTLMYLFMPNTRVPIRFALLGGVVAGSIHEVAKSLFALYASKALTYSAIYGSFGAIPLLIIGVYVNWLVALTGGLLTFASQNALTYEPNEDNIDLLLKRYSIWKDLYKSNNKVAQNLNF